MPEMSAPAGTSNPRPASAWRRGLPAPAGGALVAAAVVAAYARTFSAPLLFDDIPSITDNATIRHLGTAFFPPADATVGGRPALNLSLAANYAVSGLDVWSYHALNLAIHVAAALILFGIVRRTLAPRAGSPAGAIAFCAALLWALHPLQTESVTYVVQRAESLMGLLYLLSLYCFIRGASGARVPVRRVWQVLSVAACLLGMATKEVMVSAPVVVLLYDRAFLAGSFSESFRRRWVVYTGLASTWLVLLALVAAAHGRGGSAGFGSGVPWWGYALTQLTAVVHYLRLCLWPHPLVFDYGSDLAARSLRILPNALVVAGLMAGTVWALVRRPAIGFLGAVFFAILAPSSSIVPVATETIAEHRMYLALAPVVVLAVIGIHRWMGRAAVPCCVAVAAGLSVATWQRNQTYLSDVGIWSDTVAKRPGNARAQNNLGYVLAGLPGRSADAIAHYEEALRLKPGYAMAEFNLGNALAAVPGRRDEAIAHYGVALRLWPNHAEAHYNLGCALDRSPGRSAEAIVQYGEALRLSPDYVEAHYNLGRALETMPGRSAEAIAHFEEALRLRPGFAEAHYNLGRALETTPGRSAEAIAHYEEAVRLRPDYADAHYYLGSALQATPGRRAEAIANYEEALRARPDFAEVHFSLGFALEAEPGRRSDAIAHYEEALRLKPDYAEAHYNLGCVLQEMPGRLGDAIAHYEQSLRLKPDNAPAHCNLGNALISAGRPAEAIAQYQEALVLKPDDAAIHLNFAILLLRTPGRADEGLAQLNEALRIEPGNEAARRILDRVTGR
jgi:tetratricopeptide (TPR) repeat protein